MKRPTNAVLLGPAHPYRGGLADFDHLLARALNRAGIPCRLYTFTLQYPSFLFPGKSQLTDAPAPEGLDITRVLNSVNPLNWVRTGLRIRARAARPADRPLLDSSDGPGAGNRLPDRPARRYPDGGDHGQRAPARKPSDGPAADALYDRLARRLRLHVARDTGPARPPSTAPNRRSSRPIRCIRATAILCPGNRRAANWDSTRRAATRCSSATYATIRDSTCCSTHGPCSARRGGLDRAAQADRSRRVLQRPRALCRTDRPARHPRQAW